MSDTPEKRVETPRTDAIVAYLNHQFPATFGHIPLREKIGQLEQELQQALHFQKIQESWLQDQDTELEMEKAFQESVCKTLNEQLQQAREELATRTNTCEELVKSRSYLMGEREDLQSQLSQWQECARAGIRLYENKYLEWDSAGGQNECPHGIAEGIACRTCDGITLAKLSTLQTTQKEDDSSNR